MDDTRKQELFPYFAYLYSQKLNPETYGKAQTMEEWTSLIQENTEDIDKITAAAEQLSDEDWDSLDQQYSEQMETSSAQFAAKGAKLQKLKQGTKAKKKCKCGCEMVDSKAEGGKIISKCACGCDVLEKKQLGGRVKRPNLSKELYALEDSLSTRLDNSMREALSNQYPVNTRPYQRYDYLKKQQIDTKQMLRDIDSTYTAHPELMEISRYRGIQNPGLRKLQPTKIQLRNNDEILNREAPKSTSLNKGGKMKKEKTVVVTPAPAMKKGKTIDRIGPKKEAVKPALKKGGLVKKQSGGDINTPNPSVAKCGGKVKNRIKKGQVGTKFSKPGEKPTAADTISKYNRMHINSDGFGPQNNQGKELKTKKEILNTARKEWKGKKVDVTKEKCGGKVKQRIQSKKN